MAEIAKFLFDRRFDRPVEPPKQVWAVEKALEPEPEPEPEPPPPPPVFSEEELENARTEGYQSGHTDALDEAATATDRMASMAMSQAARGLEALSKAHGEALETMAGQAARLVEVICRKMLPVSVTETLVQEITGLVESVLPSVLDEPRLVVRVHPDVLNIVRAHLDPLAISMGYEGRLLVTPDSALERPDCRIEWTDGGVERDTARQWAEIRDIIARQSGDGTPLPDLPDLDNPGLPPPEPTPEPPPVAAEPDPVPEPPPVVAEPDPVPEPAPLALDDGDPSFFSGDDGAAPSSDEWAGFDEGALDLDAPVSGAPAPHALVMSPGDGPPLRGKAQSFPFPDRMTPFPSVGPAPPPFEEVEEASDAPDLQPVTTGEAAFPRTARKATPAEINSPRTK